MDYRAIKSSKNGKFVLRKMSVSSRQKQKIVSTKLSVKFELSSPSPVCTGILPFTSRLVVLVLEVLNFIHIILCNHDRILLGQELNLSIA